MSTSNDLFFLRKRDGIDDVELPPGAVAGIVIGILLIVALSIFFCCPCWKKKQNPRSISEPRQEDVGNEKGLGQDGINAQKTGNSSYNSSSRRTGDDRDTIVSAMSTSDGNHLDIRGGLGDATTPVSALSTGNGTVGSNELHGRNYYTGLNEADGLGVGGGATEVDGRDFGGRVNEMDAAPGLYEAGSAGLSPPPRYEQIHRKPIAAPTPVVMPAELPAGVVMPQKN